MNLVFIGSPASGKTTTAAMLFAQLKENQYAVEWVPEYARLYIADKRVSCCIAGEKFALSDNDQRKIQETQLDWERYLFNDKEDREPIVVADSWSVNALLYMKGIVPSSRIRARMAAKTATHVFYCPPLKHLQDIKDPNRIHDRKMSLQVDKKIKPLMKALGIKYHTLEGKPFARVSQIINIIGLK